MKISLYLGKVLAAAGYPWSRVSSSNEERQVLPECPDSPGSLHKTPPGHWPANGPKPSKLAVIFYYFSVIFTVIGVLVVIRAALFVDEALILGVGLCMVTVGIAFLVISNMMNKHEQRKISRYLEMKVSELHPDHNSRQPQHRRHSATHLLKASSSASSSSATSQHPPFPA